MLDTGHVYCISHQGSNKVNASGLIPFAFKSVFRNTARLVECRHID